MRLARRLIVGALLVLASLTGGASAAFAYWTATGIGTGTATTATLNPPTTVTTSYTAGASSVGLSWTAPVAGVVPQGYVVRRIQGTTSTTVCTSLTPPTSTSCTDTGLSAGTYTWTVTAIYASWTATSAPSSPRLVAPDTTAPTVVGVFSATPNGPYRAGAVIDIAVRFQEAVVVTGAPQLTLQVGASTRAIDYTAGSGGDTLTFRYTVAPGDTSPDLDYAATTSLARNGGTIKDVWDNSALLALPPPASSGSLAANAALVIDTTAPGVTAPTVPTQVTTMVSVTITPGAESDTGSGVVTATRTWLRVRADYRDGACGSFTTSPTTVANPDTSYASGSCYRYLQQVSDAAGNVGASPTSSPVMVDTSAPDAPILAFAPGTRTFANGSTVFFKGDAPSGSFSVTATATDGESGISAYVFPSLGTGWTAVGTNPRTYSWGTAGTPSAGTFSVMATNGLNTMSPPTPFSLVVDTTPPTIGPPTVPTIVTTPSVPVAPGAETDAGAGVNPATRTVQRSGASAAAGTCGTAWGAWSVVPLDASGADTTVADNMCYRYQTQVADNVGNTGTSPESSAVRIDLRPQIASVTVTNGNGTSAIGRGDQVRVVFDRPIVASGLCGAWNPSSGSYLLDGNSDITISVVQSGTADYLTVTRTIGAAASCVPAAFGQLMLGDVVAATTTFGGNGNNASSLQWDGATLTLTLRLGSGSAPAPTGPMTYVNAVVKDSFGRPIANSPFTAVGGAF